MKKRRFPELRISGGILKANYILKNGKVMILASKVDSAGT
jgi:hypothetical protein